MKLARLPDLEGTEREGVSPAGWTRDRFLLQSGGKGFPMHETGYPARFEIHDKDGACALSENS